MRVVFRSGHVEEFNVASWKTTKNSLTGDLSLEWTHLEGAPMIHRIAIPEVVFVSTMEIAG